MHPLLLLMELFLKTEVARSYKSPCQRTRVISERWFSENAYCPACPSKNLEPFEANRKVVDFRCPKCEEKFQLKAKAGNFGSVVSNSAYEPKIEAIRTNKAPNYAFLQYKPEPMQVADLFIVPKYFFSPDIIQKRPPFKATARRHGWVGSNILLGRLPIDARIHLVSEGLILSQKTVRNTWRRFSFLQEMPVSSKGWLTDILACVRKLKKRDFTLQEMYGFAGMLGKMHPQNKNIKPKIRQQLQFLRNRGIVEFLGSGKYTVIS